MSVYDEALEKLESIKKETYEVYREGYYQPDIHEVFDESDGRFWEIESALKMAKQLQQDVNELLGIINHLEHLQVADDYVPDINWERYGELRKKLLKVGK